MATHSYLLYDPTDTETTSLTEMAHASGRDTLETVRLTAPVQIVMATLTGKPYVLEVHGQSSATAHGKQGLRAKRLELLRDLNAAGLPVCLVFAEGRELFKVAWLHDLPAAQPIALGDDADRDRTARYGWPANDEHFERHPRVPVFRMIPEPKPKSQEALI